MLRNRLRNQSHHQRQRKAFYRASLALCAAAVLPVFAPLDASAQLAGKGGLTGRILDSTGAVIPDADIVIVQNGTNVKQELHTTGDGDYSFSLDPGKYSITVTHPGFGTVTQQNVSVDALQTYSVNITLPTGSVSEQVTVTQAPPLLETANASLGATLEQEEYAALPLIEDGGGQRRATDFAQLLPGVNASATNGNLTTNAGVINGGGSRGAVSAIYINGVPITSVAGEGDPRFVWTSMAVDAIDQFQVETIGYSAIYEGEGVQNYVVKRGTNQVHGSLYDYYRDTGLDTWGFQKANNPITGLPQKTSEHQHEYGLFLGLPIVKDKLFVFGGYEGYRYRHQVPYQFETIPTLLMRQGNFSELSAGCTTTVTAGCIYDPDSTTYNGKVYSRTPFPNNIIPTARLSPAALKLESYLPAPTNSAVNNNYLVNYRTGLSNWTTTNRIDYTISKRQNLSVVLAWGRQSTTAPSAVTVSSTTNGLPAPYISTQQFTPKTKVFLFEHDFVFKPNLINQIKYGFGRYDGPGYNQDLGGTFGAAANGISGLPAGQASDSFPTTTFSGNTNINRWAGYSSNRPVANGFVLIDNLQWNIGKHSFTFGGEIAWLQYNFLNNATGVNPLQLTFSNSATGGYNNSNAITSTTGNGYASYLLGAVNSGSFTLSAVPETGGRYRPISPYVQDTWRLTSKLTLDVGLRWDYYPSYREVHNRFSFLSLTDNNALVNHPGALEFGGTGTGTCNCSQPVNDSLKNFGPRFGFAYQAAPTTVIRGSYGIIYTHGNANGGSATSRQGSGLEGFSVTPTTTFVSPTQGQRGNTYWHLDTPYPAYTAPPTLTPTLGTYYTTASSQASQTPTYADPYLGGKAPQFTNYSLGIQQALSSTINFTLTYVGSEGRFLLPDSLNGRGYYTNGLDPKYLSLGTLLSAPASTAGNLAAAGATLPYATFGGVGNPSVAQALKPFPQYGSISDAYGFVGRTWYNALQAYATKRFSNGISFLTDYTWSRSIDNDGTFRSGYDIPGNVASDGQFHAARTLDRSLSLGDQRHKFVFTGTYNLPFGTGKLGGENRVTRVVFGGFRLSTIFSAYSGPPISVTMNAANTNPAQNVAYPEINPVYTGNGRVPGLDRPHTQAALGQVQYLDPNAFVATPNYVFSTTARTAAYSTLFQPGNYRWDASLRRAFAIPTGGFHEGTKLALEADYFNVTNHTHFVYSQSNAVVNTWGTASYGTMNVDSSFIPDRALQLAARIEF